MSHIIGEREQVNHENEILKMTTDDVNTKLEYITVGVGPANASVCLPDKNRQLFVEPFIPSHSLLKLHVGRFSKF